MAQRSFVSSAKTIAAWTLVSRVTGLARDTLLNAAFGQNWVQDAFNYGFRIPNLFRRLFGEGALVSVFVPTFTDTLERQGRPAAWSLLANVLARMTVVLLLITIVLEAVALSVFASVPAGSDRALMAGLTALMLPFMISICIVALFCSLLNCLGRFALPAAMPIVLNLCMIAGLLIAMRGDDMQRNAYIAGVSVLAAGIVQLALLRPAMRGLGVPIGLKWQRHDPAMAAMMTAFMPVMLSQGAMQLSSFLDAQMCASLTRAAGDPEAMHWFGRAVAYPLTPGALSAVNNAERLYQFPLGVLAISLATAALPTFSRLASQGDLPGLRAALARALRLAAFEGLPCGVMLFVLAEPIIALLFQHGKYTAENTQRAADVLRWYAPGIWAFCMQHVVLRGFYSVKETRTPMRVGIAMMGLNLAISFSLLWHAAIREAAFAIATTIATALNVAITLVLLRKRLEGRLGMRALAASLLRTLAASAVAGVAAWAAYAALGGAGRATGAITDRVMLTFLPLAAGAAAFLAAARGLRMEELGWLVRTAEPCDSD